jgi:predicted acylesterase/phospholipase RssA
MTDLHLNLALQGGGAHGAFTWGVLDRLMQEFGIIIDRISGTSAGALNGAALATGYARGGGEGARMHLLSLPNEAHASDIESSTRRTVDMLLFLKMRNIGIAACERWLAAHKQDTSVRSSMVDYGHRYPFRAKRQLSAQTLAQR